VQPESRRLAQIRERKGRRTKNIRKRVGEKDKGPGKRAVKGLSITLEKKKNKQKKRKREKKGEEATAHKRGFKNEEEKRSPRQRKEHGKTKKSLTYLGGRSDLPWARSRTTRG